MPQMWTALAAEMYVTTSVNSRIIPVEEVVTTQHVRRKVGRGDQTDAASGAKKEVRSCVAGREEELSSRVRPQNKGNPMMRDLSRLVRVSHPTETRDETEREREREREREKERKREGRAAPHDHRTGARRRSNEGGGPAGGVR